MNAIMKLVQGTDEWLTYRMGMRNASESAAVMGISPWTTPYQLWLNKTGRSVQETTPAMAHGTRLEPAARAAYEERTGAVMQPLVMQDGLYSASLDGITLDGELILEVKAPFRLKQSTLWTEVAAGQVPKHYMVQIQHQLMVSKAVTADLWVYADGEGLLVSVERDEAMMAAIREAWKAYQQYLDGDTPPPLTDQDTKIRADTAWREAAESFRGWKSVIDEAQAKADAAKAMLIELTSHPRETGFGVSVTRFWKLGAVDYKKLPALAGVDLELYRGASREEIRVTVGA